MLRRKFVQLIATAGAGTLVSAAATSAAASEPAANARVTFHVKGFSCITCAVGLDTMLTQKRGVVSTHSSYPESVVVIRFNSSQITESELRSFIAEMGFVVEEQSR